MSLVAAKRQCCGQHIICHACRLCDSLAQITVQQRQRAPVAIYVVNIQRHGHQQTHRCYNGDQPPDTTPSRLKLLHAPNLWLKTLGARHGWL